VAGEMLLIRGFVTTDIKTKIHYNGREFASVKDLPIEARLAWEKAARDAIDATEDNQKLYEDVLSAIENNGEVTLPGAEKTEPLLTKREVAVIALLGLGLVSLIVARIVS
jgi:hypothetical protein